MMTASYIFRHEAQTLEDARKLIRQLRHCLKHGTKNLIKAKSGYRGVQFFKQCPRKPWKAYYMLHGSQVCVGYFATKEEAAKAYNAAVKKYTHKQYLLNDL